MAYTIFMGKGLQNFGDDDFLAHSFTRSHCISPDSEFLDTCLIFEFTLGCILRL